MTDEEKRVVEWLRSPEACNECVWFKDVEDCGVGANDCIVHQAADMIERLVRELDAAKYDLDLVTKGHRGCDVCIMLNKPDGMCKSSRDCEDVGGWRGVCDQNTKGEKHE